MMLPPGPFGCIIADPPWQFRTYSGESAVPTQGKDPYETMTLDQLKALPVAEIAAKDCLLLMWIVGAHLEEALDLGRSWGFTFKTDGLIWRKVRSDTPDLFGEDATSMGMGYWFRKEAELSLLFTRGSPKRLSGGVRQLIDRRRREHSRKPDDQYARVEALVDGPYLEMFARQCVPGWTAWGHQVGKFEVAA